MVDTGSVHFLVDNNYITLPTAKNEFEEESNALNYRSCFPLVLRNHYSSLPEC